MKLLIPVIFFTVSVGIYFFFFQGNQLLKNNEVISQSTTTSTFQNKTQGKFIETVDKEKSEPELSQQTTLETSKKTTIFSEKKKEEGKQQEPPEIYPTNNTLSLWTPVEKNYGNMKSIKVKVHPNFLEHIQVGQAIELFIPQINQHLYGKIDHTANKLNNKVITSYATLENSGDYGSITFIQNEGFTLIQIITNEGGFTVSYPHDSDQATITKHSNQAISFEHSELINQ